MRKIQFVLTALFAVILISGCGSTQQITKQGDNTLWKLEHEDATIYLLGSIHMAKEDFYPLDPAIEKAYEDSEYLIVEVNTQNLKPTEMLSMMMYNDGSTLKQHLSDSIFKKFKDNFDRLNLPEMFYSRLKPWAAVLTIMTMELKANGYNEDSGIDRYFMKKAEADGKDIYELESFKQQIDLLEEFDSMPGEFLEYSIGDIEHEIKRVDDLSAAWKKGNTDMLEKILMQPGEEKEQHDYFLEKFLFKRNENMTETVMKYIKMGGKYFIVVGAGHLVGERGMVELLKRKLNE